MSDLLSLLASVLNPEPEVGAPVRPEIGAGGGGPVERPPIVPGARFSPDGMLMPKPEVGGDYMAGPVPPPNSGPPQMPVADGLRRMFQPPQPAPQQAPVQTPGAISGNDVQRFIRSVMTGAAKADPSAPKFSAFAQGGAGAMQNSYGEIEREKALKAQQDERRRVNDLRAEREGRLQERMILTDQRNQRLDERRGQSADLADLERQTRIQRITDPQADTKDRIAIQRLIRDKERDLRREVDNARLTEKDAKSRLDQYKLEIEEQFKVKRRQPLTDGQPQVKPPPPPPGTLYPHGGDIYRFKGGENKLENWEKVPQ